MFIYIKSNVFDGFKLELNDNIKINKLKEMISEKKNIDIKQINLIFKSKYLNNDTSLLDNYIKNDDTIIMNYGKLC